MTIFTKQNLNPILGTTFMPISVFEVCVFNSVFHLVHYLISPEAAVRYFFKEKKKKKRMYAQMLKYAYE